MRLTMEEIIDYRGDGVTDNSKVIGPDPEIDRLGDAYLLYSRNRQKPMTFDQFYEINRPDETRVRSWVRMDKHLATGIKLKVF